MASIKKLNLTINLLLSIIEPFISNGVIVHYVLKFKSILASIQT